MTRAELSSQPVLQPHAVRFRDSLRVVLAQMPHTPNAQSPNARLSLDSAVIMCEHDRWKTAREVMLQIIESSTEEDSIHWEALFQLGECAALRGDYSVAAAILGEVAYREQGPPSDVHARAIVRLGHVFCQLGRFADAKTQFARLRNLYPYSLYLKVADCKVISR
ncbi:MAG: tetratricopeptide repeat protein [Chlorobi bacterium]|nr:tetratricopeptide repeat protein [Chlorobiota bacterium]